MQDLTFIKQTTVIAMFFVCMEQAQARHALTYNFDVSAYSPVQSIHAFTDDWDDPLDAGESAFIQGNMSMLLENELMRYRLLWRYDYLLSFSSDAATVYWSYKNDEKLHPHRVYDLAIHANHNERIGMSIGKRFDISDARITIDVNAYHGKKLLDGSVRGNMLTQSTLSAQRMLDSIRQADATLGYAYSQPALKEDELEWTPDQPNGMGYGIDISYVHSLASGWQWGVSVRDLLGYMHWDDTPETDYTLRYSNSTRPPYDLEGQLSDDKSHRQTMPWHARAFLNYEDAAGNGVRVSHEKNEVNGLSDVAVYAQPAMFGKSVVASLQWEPETQAVGVSLQHKQIGMSYKADHFNWQRAKRLQLSIHAHIDW